MKRLLHKTPVWIQKLYPDFVWKIPTDHKELFLTFDDGPIPEVTEFVVDELAKYNAQATFFCVGENIQKHLEIAKRVVEAGHALGNHTFNHLKGWQTNNFRYWKNVLACDKQISPLQEPLLLFRPPYGRIKRSQAAALHKYKIVMWNRLAWDFEKKLDRESAIRHLTDDAPTGSIFVFHDNVKSYANMREVLPAVLKHYSSNGFIFKAIPPNACDVPQ